MDANDLEVYLLWIRLVALLRSLPGFITTESTRCTKFDLGAEAVG